MKSDLAATIVKVPCPDCGELSPEPPERIVQIDVISCSLCGELIDLLFDDFKSIVDNAKTLWQSL
jgi:hypothetical protein